MLNWPVGDSPRRAGPRWTVLGAAALILAGCGAGTSVEPNLPREDVAGGYTLSTLSFDPQGSLPEANVLERLGVLGIPAPTLLLSADGTVQLLFQDPGTSLLRLVQGSFRTTPDGVLLDLGDTPTYAALLLPRSATFLRAADGSLTLDQEATVSRSSLNLLVPEWAAEPLVDPVPGQLRVVFIPVS